GPIIVSSIGPSISFSGNHPPVANASGPYYGVIDEEMEFDGSGSYDLDGTIVHYGWSFGDGTTDYGEKVTHIYANGGSYLVTLTVLDNNGASDIEKTTALISVPNRPPSNPMISGPTNGSKNTTYSYAFGSIDLDKGKINYFIDWGDGYTSEIGFLPSGHLFSMLHSWAESGKYTIAVTASDNQSSSSSEMTVHIEENIIVDNIAIIILGILALIALIIALMYSKKGKKKQ
ncbi:MAG: PKD domain-containing protein, partial [Thermoplasmata archaeon]